MYVYICIYACLYIYIYMHVFLYAYIYSYLYMSQPMKVMFDKFTGGVPSSVSRVAFKVRI